MKPGTTVRSVQCGGGNELNQSVSSPCMSSRAVCPHLRDAMGSFQPPKISLSGLDGTAMGSLERPQRRCSIRGKT